MRHTSPAIETYFAFPVTDERAVPGGKWHVAHDPRGGIVASSGWSVFYATDYGRDLAARTGVRLGWYATPPAYIQHAALQLVKEA